MSNANPGPPLLVLFAKAPLPGAAKTRLAADIGDAAAARIASALIVNAVELALRAWPGEVRLAVWPDADHALFWRIRQHYRIGMDLQVPGDLGEKMLAALHGGIDRGHPTAIMGCDAPQCTAAQLNDAANGLITHDAVFAPADDGGFWFVGLSRKAPGLFSGVNWHERNTLEQSLGSARRIGLDVDTSLPQLFDIDVKADLERLKTDFPAVFNALWGPGAVD